MGLIFYLLNFHSSLDIGFTNISPIPWVVVFFFLSTFSIVFLKHKSFYILISKYLSTSCCRLSYEKMPNSRSQKLRSRISPRIFIVLVLTFRAVINFELVFADFMQISIMPRLVFFSFLNFYSLT